MKKYLVFLIAAFFVFSFSQNTFASNVGVFNDGKTIRELRKEIENFEKMNENLDSNLKKFIEENKLDSYLKKGLSKDDVANIKLLVNSYVSRNINLENILKKSKNEQEIEKIQSDLLDSISQVFSIFHG